MKMVKWATLVMILVMLAGGGLYFSKLSNQHNLEKPIRQQQADSDQDITTKGQKPEKKLVSEPLPNLGLQAKSVILLDAKNGDILYDKNIDQSMPTASMSKLMTEFLVLESIHNNKITWEKSVSISDYAFAIGNNPGFASVHLNNAQSYTVRELFNAMAIHSANDAAIALAEAVAGSEKDFVVRMNETAKQLGLENTHFVNSTGLNNLDLGNFYSTGSPNDTNIMSAKDVALLAQQLIAQFPEILDVVAKPKLKFGQHTYTNSNWMLPAINKQNAGFEGVDGLKTGYTDEAGYCFVGTVKKYDRRFISVVMGASSKISRYSETARLYETAFKQIAIK
jgi:D-alanyl-D-alanine carboxypeptidase (penicillin-binding protein 5/6)